MEHVKKKKNMRRMGRTKIKDTLGKANMKHMMDSKIWKKQKQNHRTVVTQRKYKYWTLGYETGEEN